MGWFKHDDHASDDPFIKSLFEEFKHAGYMGYFVILELLRANYDIKMPETLKISSKHLQQKLHFSSKRLKRFLNSCVEHGKATVVTQNNIYYIKINNFERFHDRWLHHIRREKTVQLEKNYCTVKDKINKDKENTSSLQVRADYKNGDRSGGATRQKALRPSRFLKIDSILKKVLGKFTQEEK